MADDGSHSGQERPGAPLRLKRVVCTSCRQSKVRCIVSDRTACERCIRLDIECNRDPEFKRTSKSRKIAELEKQVQLLASAINTRGQPTTCSTPSFPATSFGTHIRKAHAEPLSVAARNEWEQPQISACVRDCSGPVAPIVLSPPFTDTAAITSPEPILARPPAAMPRTIETLQLSPDRIDTLFQIFFENHHPFLPFLDSLQSPDQYYKSSPSLFWAIISIASRRYREDATLFTVLSEWTTKLLWSEIASPPYRLSTVQAILLLAIWPFPTYKSTNDTSVTLSSIAISAAMQIGLHRPLSSHDFKQTTGPNWGEVDLSMLTRTWAVANIVSQTSGAVAGHLPNAPFDWMIDRACEMGNVYTLPDPLRHILMIQRICHRVTQAMSTISYDPITAQSPPPGEVSSLMMSWQNDMAHFESELDSLAEDASIELSEIDLLYLAAARIHLHSFYFFDSSTTESRKCGIMKAYDSAINIVSAFMSSDRSSETLLYLPYYLFRCLLTAACILLKVLKSSYSQDVGDFEKGRSAFNDTILAIMRSSISNNDTAGKAAQMLSRVWHNTTASDQSPPQLTVQSRFGASITHDFIRVWRKEFGVAFHAKNGPPGVAHVVEPSLAPFTESFPEEMIFSFDLLDDPVWGLGMGMGDAPLFGNTGT